MENILHQFEKITKEDFIKTLKTSKSEFIYRDLELNESTCERILKDILDTDYKVLYPTSYIGETRNYMIFKNSLITLDFHDINTCYRYKNIIISHDKWFDNFDKIYRYKMLVYAIEK